MYRGIITEWGAMSTDKNKSHHNLDCFYLLARILPQPANRFQAFLNAELAKYATWEQWESRAVQLNSPIFKSEPAFRSAKGQGVGRDAIYKFLNGGEVPADTKARWDESRIGRALRVIEAERAAEIPEQGHYSWMSIYRSFSTSSSPASLIVLPMAFWSVEFTDLAECLSLSTRAVPYIKDKGTSLRF